jgi:hypothetical protein
VAATRRFAGLDPSTWPGSRFDWAFSVLATLLVAAGYYDAWIDRHLKPQAWAHAPSQGAWLLVTGFLAGTALARWLRDRRPDSILPDGYLLSALGCAIFAAGILSGIWWQDVYGPEIPGLAAIFRPSNLIQIAAGGLIVTGPLRAAVGRGELVAGPTALISATLLLATITFFSQWDHPYVDQWAFDLRGLPPTYEVVGQELGALALMMQAAIVTATILLLLRQIRLPRGSITVMLTATAFLVSTQFSRYQYVGVAVVVGVLSDLLLYWAQPRSDRLTELRIFAALTGGLLPAVYLAYVAVWEGGTYWGQDVVYGTILTCGLVGWLVSYFTFPNREVAKAAAVLWPPPDQESSPSAPDITVERLEHALKVFNNLRNLAESPLVYLRCLPSHNAASLRQVLEDAISTLRASPSQVDAQAGEILSLYYVRRIGGHYAVERRVGLSRAAYFNRRSYGVRRLVDRLKELEEQATTA